MAKSKTSETSETPPKLDPETLDPMDPALFLTPPTLPGTFDGRPPSRYLRRERARPRRAFRQTTTTPPP